MGQQGWLADNGHAPINDVCKALLSLAADNERLRGCLARANENHEKFERLWYLVQDERDSLRAERSALGVEIDGSKRMINEAIHRWQDVTAERDAYRSMLCDLMAFAKPMSISPPLVERQWDRARELLKNGPVKP